MALKRDTEFGLSSQGSSGRRRPVAVAAQIRLAPGFGWFRARGARHECWVGPLLWLAV